MLKKICAVSCLLFSFFLCENFAKAQTFSDVNSDHPYYAAIEALAEKGILNGYPDKTFRPDNAINRVEILKVLLLGSNIDVEETTYNAGFPDVISNSWYAKYVVKAKEKGIVRGNPNGLFYPNNQVNFAEALKMLALSNNVELESKISSDPFLDVPKDSWYAPYFAYAKSVNIIQKTNQEYATPDKPLDRGETAQLIFLFQEAQNFTAENQIATYYADIFQDRTTASGEIFDQNKFTAAHKTLPFGTQVKVTNLENNESVIVRINDRGPFASNPNYVIDLSKSAFQSISPLSRGIIKIRYEILDTQEKVEVDLEAPLDSNLDQLNLTEEKTEKSAYAEVQKEESSDELSTCKREISKELIPKDFFAGIDLAADLPNIFQKNEIYKISGKIDDSNYKVVTVFLINTLDRNEEYRFEGTLDNGKFEIPVIFSKIGDFNIGILKGESGQSYITEINVISNQCLGNFEETGLAPTNIQIEYKDGQSQISWQNHGQNLSKVEIWQGENKTTYILNNYQETLKIPYKDFANFSQGEAFYSVSGANNNSTFSIDQSSQWSRSEEKSFNAVKHHRAFNKLNEINLDKLIYTYTFGETLKFSGISTRDLAGDASIILPTGLVKEEALLTEVFGKNTLGKKIVEANDKFELNYTPALQGTHILEINKDDGFAVINMAIYENGKIPLIPDIWDSNRHFLGDSDREIDLELSKQELLRLVNSSRQEFGADNLIVSNKLNQLAQSRAEDMANNNYLSHKNLEGKYASDLKINYGIKSNVSENIAKDVNIDFTHAGLMRSAIHRENILNQKWTQIGLGFAIDSEGYLVTCEIFSEDEFSEKDLPHLRSQILETVNLKRSEILLSDNDLDHLAQEWSKNILNRSIWFEDPETGISLSYLINSQIASNKQSASTILKGDFEPILEQIDQNETVIDAKWKKLGTGITQNNDGSLNVTMVYSD